MRGEQAGAQRAGGPSFGAGLHGCSASGYECHFHCLGRVQKRPPTAKGMVLDRFFPSQGQLAQGLLQGHFPFLLCLILGPRQQDSSGKAVFLPVLE